MVSLSDTYNGSELKYGVRDLHEMGSPGQNQVPMMESLIRPTGVWVETKFRAGFVITFVSCG
jgi:hypothetical protein